MREILFRVKRKFKDLYNKPLDIEWEYITLKDGMYDESNYLMETLGQYTMKNDINKIKVFEGDIVSGYINNDFKPSIKGYVGYNKQTYSYYIYCLKTNTKLRKLSAIKKLEVIGTIHDLEENNES